MKRFLLSCLIISAPFALAHPTTLMGVNVTLIDECTGHSSSADLCRATAVEGLKREGMIIEDVLKDLGAVIGKVSPANFDRLKNVKGVLLVSPEHFFGIPEELPVEGA